MYRVGIMDFMENAVPLPVIPLSRMTQIVASRPAPQTQNRGRRRLRLGLLGALIPPAASAPVSSGPCRGATPPRSGRSLSHKRRCSSDLSPGSCFIGRLHLRWRTRGSARLQHLSLRSQTRHPDSSSRLQARQISSRCLRDSPHASGASSPPSRVSPPPPQVLRVFFWSLSEDHQGAPSAGWGVWSHGKPWLRGGPHNIREA